MRIEIAAVALTMLGMLWLVGNVVLISSQGFTDETMKRERAEELEVETMSHGSLQPRSARPTGEGGHAMQPVELLAQVRAVAAAVAKEL